jgi:hypothetical protein
MNIVGTIGMVEKSEIGRQRRESYKEEYRERKKLISVLPEGSEFLPKTKIFMIPESLTIEDFESLNLAEKFIPNILLFLSLVHNITTFKRIVIREENPYAEINSLIISKFLFTLGPHSKVLLSSLESQKWIEIDHSYKVGAKSKGYRIGPKFQDSNWIKKDWAANLEYFLPAITVRGYISRQKGMLYDLWNRATVYFTTWRTMPEGDLKELCRQTEVIGLRIRVDFRPEIHQVIKDCAVEHIEEQKRLGEWKPHWTLEKQIQNYYDSLSLFDGHNFSASCHDSQRFENGTDRLFSNVVNLKSELRQFLQLDGKSFVNVDIQSCQVALLSNFYLPEDSAEKDKFISIICGQDIYTFIAGDLIPRKVAKTYMFRVMFDKNANQSGPVWERFKKEFPILSSRIISEKREKGYKSVAFGMQSTEASIMIHGVLKSLFFQDKVDCVSIHDSIFCLPENAELVKNRIYSFFFAAMGFCPTIKIS